MQKDHYLLLRVLALFIFLGTAALYACEVLVSTPEGETFVFDIDPKENFESLQERVATLSNSDVSTLFIECSMNGRFHSLEMARHGGNLGFPRNYLAEITHAEKCDICFIVNTLANKNIFSIAMLKSELEKAGERVKRVHPLQFLSVVFTDEKLQVGIRNIRRKAWVWSQFFGGLEESLSTETKNNNMKEEYLQHFAQTVKTNWEMVRLFVEQQKWQEFVDYLISQISREGDHDRYDT